jgi:hypothetical protein
MPDRLYGAPLFARALGPRLRRYARAVQTLHRVADATVAFGHADVERGAGMVSRLVGRAFGFPPAGRAMPTRVTVIADGARELWLRRFAGHAILTRLEPAPDRTRPTVTERFRWGVAFDLAVAERGGRLGFEVTAMRVLGAPMPRFLWPLLAAEERAERGGFAFDVAIALRFFGPLIHYRGWVRPA